jgi:predicted transcriptional regulator
LFLDLSPQNNEDIKSLAIKSVYADRIREKSKTFELRTYPPGILPGSWCALYETAPTKAIQTVFKAGRTFKLTPNEAWEMHSTNFGIDFDSYFRYFRRRAWTYGVEIADVRSFEAVSLYELRESPGFTVPQMCQKLKTTHQRILSATDKL